MGTAVDEALLCSDGHSFAPPPVADGLALRLRAICIEHRPSPAHQIDDHAVDFARRRRADRAGGNIIDDFLWVAANRIAIASAAPAQTSTTASPGCIKVRCLAANVSSLSRPIASIRGRDVSVGQQALERYASYQYADLHA